MIRKAEIKDVSAVGRIYKNIHDAESRGELVIGWIADIYPLESTARDAFERGDLFVYEEEGQILGSAIINQLPVDAYSRIEWKYPAEENEVMVLHTLVVDPSAMKRGIGREFVKFYEDYAQKAGCKVLQLDTNERNSVARRFYQKLGYREAGIVPCRFNGIPGVQLVCLEKQCSQ